MHLTTFWFLTNLGKIFVAKLLQGCWGSKAESRLWYQEIAHGSFWRSFKRRRRRGRGISCLCIWERWHSNAQRLVVFWISIKPWKHTSAGHANSSTGIATYNRYFFSLFFPFLLLLLFFFFFFFFFFSFHCLINIQLVCPLAFSVLLATDYFSFFFFYVSEESSSVHPREDAVCWKDRGEGRMG